jgi:predicted transcriptional regulator
MREHRVSSLPVAEGHAVVDMITESDIFRAIVSSTLELASPLPVAVNGSILPRSII